MGANLKEPFGESCCDGGKCNIKKESAQPCGCDPGADWVCAVHSDKLDQAFKELMDHKDEVDD